MHTVHLGVVWNPTKTDREVLEAALESAVTQLPSHAARPAVSWHETDSDDPGRAATRAAISAGADVVCAAGGDGTVRVVAECLAGNAADQKPDLAIVPLGTGNLLARNWGVPLSDPTAAFARALTTDARPMDLGWAEATIDGVTARHAFTVMVGFGIDAHMIAETSDELKERAGWLAYVESLGRAVSASEVINLRVARDSGDSEAERAHTLIVGNCGTLQGGITLLPDADPSDGELDVLLLRASGVAGWADTLRNMVWDNGVKRFLTGSDTATSSAHTTHERITMLTVELDEPRACEVDGDELGEASRLVITVQPEALAVR